MRRENTQRLRVAQICDLFSEKFTKENEALKNKYKCRLLFCTEKFRLLLRKKYSRKYCFFSTMFCAQYMMHERKTTPMRKIWKPWIWGACPRERNIGPVRTVCCMLDRRTVSTQPMNAKNGGGRDTERNKTINLSEQIVLADDILKTVWINQTGEGKTQLSL